MNIRVNAPKDLTVLGKANVPASKSICNRVLTINALAGGRGKIYNSSTAQDSITLDTILSNFQRNKVMDFHCDVGHAGTAMRFLTAYFSIQKGVQIITGSERMKNRPIGLLVEALRSLGANIEYMEKDGYPPLKIREGMLQGGVTIDGGVSSQYISALMMVGPYLKGGLTIQLENKVVSTPYIKMTQSIMRDFGVEVQFENKQITVPESPYLIKDYTVESDWSGVSYWYSVAALARKAHIIVPSLFEKSLQGDIAVVDIFAELGVATTFNKQGIEIVKVGPPKTTFIHWNFNHCPDLAQTAVVACLGLGVEVKIDGLETLKVKETDRLLALKIECEKMGAQVDVTNSSIHLIPDTINTNMAIDTYDDHRMALAFAPIALQSESIVINDSEVIKKSYPNYWEDLINLGFSIATTK